MTSLVLLALVLAPSKPQTLHYTVDGLDRTADVYAPSKTSAHPPLVFGFHGHGGNTRNASNSFHIQDLWPEAVVVYMQGLPCSGGIVDKEGKFPGWQGRKGLLGDRDLHFFDSVYADLTKRFHVDTDRVYAMGHSNGGLFTYLLMQQRGELFAAFGPSGSPSFVAGMPTKPVFQISGENDPLVNFSGQSRTLDLVKKRNGCSTEGVKIAPYATLYKGKDGNDVVAYFHPGGHEYPREEAPPLIVKFFQQHTRKQ